MKLWLAFWLGMLIAFCGASMAQDKVLEKEVDAYLVPFVEGKNFTGAVLIGRGDRILVNKAYGEANYSLHVGNTPSTRFHIASISKPFTAAAILLLEERGRLGTSEKLSRYLPDFPHAGEITLAHLLTHTSGIPNVNDLPDYATAQRFPQTPQSLIKLVKDRPLNFAPGTQYEYSNSNYNLLAFVIEKVSGKAYGEFLREAILAPLALKNTAHDGDAAQIVASAASGYQPAGVAELENAPYIDWSAKTGNGSLYSTTGDLFQFIRAFAQGSLIRPATVRRIWNEHRGNQYGWFVRQRNGHVAVATNGRSPGFTASAEYYPDRQLTVIVLSNSYSPVSQSPIAEDLAALALGCEVTPPSISAVPVAPASLRQLSGVYRFGADFYRPNADVNIRIEKGMALLDWGNGFISPLVPLTGGEFLDRQFWARLKMDGDGNGFTYSSSGRHFHASRGRR